MSTGTKRLVGAGMIVGFILILVLGVTKPNPFKSAHTYWAEFDTVHGLGAIDRDVRIAGVKVGTIGEVVREGDNARAELILTLDYPVHEDARANMRPHTLFEGSNFVDFFPGSPSAPLLEEGETIPLKQTNSYTTLDEALRVLKPEIRLNLRQLAKVGGDTLKGKAITGIQETLKNLPGLAKNLAPGARALQGEHRDELVGAIGGIAGTVDAVAEEEAQLVPLVQRYNRTVAALTIDRGAPLDATLASLPGALRELHDASPPLIELIDRLERFSGEIRPALPKLAAAFDETTPVLADAVPVLQRATPLVHNARILVKRLADAAPGLKRLLELVNKALEKSDALDVFLEPSAFGAETNAAQLAGAFSAANAAFKSFQKDNPNGEGHFWRVGAYVHQDAATGLDALGAGTRSADGPVSLDASCADVEQVDEGAARQLRAIGGCR